MRLGESHEKIQDVISNLNMTHENRVQSLEQKIVQNERTLLQVA